MLRPDDAPLPASAAPDPEAFSDRVERTAAEVANALTHGAGLALAAAGLVALVVLAVVRSGEPRAVVAAAVFGGTLVLLYGASTVYHTVTGARLKARLRLLDHLAILYLIAGTYTPFALVALRGPWGAGLLASVWALALGGTAYKVRSSRRYTNGATWIYLAMGWLCVLFAKPLWSAVPASALVWLAVGGLLYTGGVFFYARDRGFDHAVWHGFVLGGSLCHYAAVWRLMG